MTWQSTSKNPTADFFMNLLRTLSGQGPNLGPMGSIINAQTQPPVAQPSSAADLINIYANGGIAGGQQPGPLVGNPTPAPVPSLPDPWGNQVPMGRPPYYPGPQQNEGILSKIGSNLRNPSTIGELVGLLGAGLAGGKFGAASYAGERTRQKELQQKLGLEERQVATQEKQVGEMTEWRKRQEALAQERQDLLKAKEDFDKRQALAQYLDKLASGGVIENTDQVARSAVQMFGMDEALVPFATDYLKAAVQGAQKANLAKGTLKRYKNESTGEEVWATVAPDSNVPTFNGKPLPSGFKPYEKESEGTPTPPDVLAYFGNEMFGVSEPEKLTAVQRGAIAERWKQTGQAQGIMLPVMGEVNGVPAPVYQPRSQVAGKAVPKTVYDPQGGFATGGMAGYSMTPVNETTKTHHINAESGLTAALRVEKLLKENPDVLVKGALPGSAFARSFDQARTEMMDVLRRLRTGAAINQSEEATYMKYVPTLMDLTDPRAIQDKLLMMKTFYSKWIIPGYNPGIPAPVDPANVRKVMTPAEKADAIRERLKSKKK